MADHTPESEANAAADYLAALLGRGVPHEYALRLTTAWILSRAATGTVAKLIEALKEPDEDRKPWEG